MKRFRDIYVILKKISKLPIKNIKTLSQRQKMGKTYSLTQDMIENMGTYLKDGKLHGEQASLVET